MTNSAKDVVHVLIMVGVVAVCGGVSAQPERPDPTGSEGFDWCREARHRPTDMTCFRCFTQKLDACDSLNSRATQLICAGASWLDYWFCQQRIPDGRAGDILLNWIANGSGEKYILFPPEQLVQADVDDLSRDQTLLYDTLNYFQDQLDFLDDFETDVRKVSQFALNVENTGDAELGVGVLLADDGGTHYRTLDRVVLGDAATDMPELVQGLADADIGSTKSLTIDWTGLEGFVGQSVMLLVEARFPGQPAPVVLSVIPIRLSDSYDLNGDGTFDTLDRNEAMNRFSSGEMGYDEMQRIVNAEK